MISYDNRWYEDLQCTEVDEIIAQRLKAGDKLTLNDGKLLERLLTIKMLRENIPARSRRWGWGQQAEEGRETNPTKACFYPQLLPMGQQRLDSIRCVSANQEWCHFVDSSPVSLHIPFITNACKNTC